MGINYRGQHGQGRRTGFNHTVVEIARIEPGLPVSVESLICSARIASLIFAAPIPDRRLRPRNYLR
jgi:hypothetical protein